MQGATVERVGMTLFVRSMLQKQNGKPFISTFFIDSNNSYCPNKAVAAQQSPLRRWKRYFHMFSTIDAAIVVASSNNKAGSGKNKQGKEKEEALRLLRQATGDIVQELCEAPADDPAAENLCNKLDKVMVEYLLALKAVIVALEEARTELVKKGLGALQYHEASPHIRSLARRIIQMWRDPPAQRDNAPHHSKVVSAPLPNPKKIASGRANNKANSEKTKTPRKTKANGKAARVEEPLPKKKRAPVASKTKPTAKMPATVVGNGCDGDTKMAATKRKLQQGYQEAADAKRQRKIQVI
ncbi:hypothetical protein PR202_gb28365 [Eleusine coracana subsp. coracana]|uniref:TFIIS N-terminal domain-containing protein n=1 Tax=Eleusine coracana subsp. coracana TaxID=191504 RepID=A0AAV5FX51_ELECO|nr:hypothetical protein PR202_gb28365 [Eleusine coracana subsp. coracana]